MTAGDFAEAVDKLISAAREGGLCRQGIRASTKAHRQSLL